MAIKRLCWGVVLALGVLPLGACCSQATDGAELANPAAAYCEGQGYTVELRTDENGAYGVCIFPDGTECDEWAFYRGECGPGETARATGTSDTPVPETWINLVELAGLVDTVDIEILESAAVEFSGYVHRLTVSDPDVVARIVAALDVPIQLRPVVEDALCPGWYLLRFRLADGVVQEFGYGCDAGDTSALRGLQGFWQGQDAEPPAQFSLLIQEQLATSPMQTIVVGWYGFVTSIPGDGEYDDYFSLVPEGAGEFGVAGADAAVEAQIVALRDREEPGKCAHFWGTLTCGVDDYNGCQLVVTCLRVDGPAGGGPSGHPYAPDPVEGWEGFIISNPPMTQYDDHFVLSGQYLVLYGINSADPAVAAQLEQVRDTLMPVRVWGELACGVPDTNGCRIEVTRIEPVEESVAPEMGE
jgi:putative hemolysin